MYFVFALGYAIYAQIDHKEIVHFPQFVSTLRLCTFVHDPKWKSQNFKKKTWG